MMLADTTDYAEVIGDPVAHSKSPLIHGFWLDRLGLTGGYRTAHVSSAGLAAYLAERSADPCWRGCNVTIPHKIAVIDRLTVRDRLVKAVGAVNCVWRDGNGALIGTNTDVEGFAEPLRGRDWRGAHATVIGSGGAARAVLFALAELGFGHATLVARNRAVAEALLATFALPGIVLGWDAPLPGADLLVNASPCGMTGFDPLAPDLAPLPDSAWVYDLVYAPLDTGLLRAARARGLATVDGLAMLIGQAARAFELFFGHPAPRTYDAELRAMLVA